MSNNRYRNAILLVFVCVAFILNSSDAKELRKTQHNDNNEVAKSFEGNLQLSKDELSQNILHEVESHDEQSKIKIEIEIEHENKKKREDPEYNRRMLNVFSKGPRQQNEQCTCSSQCAAGLTCFRAFTASSCQPSFAMDCFNKVFLDNFSLDNNDEEEGQGQKSMSGFQFDLIDDLKDFGESYLEDPDKILKEVAKLAVLKYGPDVLGFVKKFNQCAIDSPDFEFPKGIARSKTGGNLVRVDPDTGRELADPVEIFGFELKLPKFDFGVQLDLSALVGGNLYLGMLMDLINIDWNKLDFTNFDITDLNYEDIIFGAFGNICGGMAIGGGGKFTFSGGLQYSKLNSTVEDTAETVQFPGLIPGLNLPGLFAYANEWPGSVNYCTGLDLGAGAGLGNFFCGVGFLGILECDFSNYYFTLGANTGATVGGMISAAGCSLRNYIIESFQDFMEEIQPN